MEGHMLKNGLTVFLLSSAVFLGCSRQAVVVASGGSGENTSGGSAEGLSSGSEAPGELSLGGSDAPSTENRIIGAVSDTRPQKAGSIRINGIGTFAFEPRRIRSVRDDIFQEGYFSIFDILVYLDEEREINLEYHFDEKMNTHVINSINGKENWWYLAYYDNGWSEANNFRMDHFPYKDGSTVRVSTISAGALERIYGFFREEIERKAQAGGKLLIPEVIIRGPGLNLRFEDVEVTPHELRSDFFRPGAITAVDVIMSLGDQGKLGYDLQWYESIGFAEVVQSYFVVRIGAVKAHDRCGFVYEAGPKRAYGNHIHIPPDLRVINSPEYMEIFWICL
jgi:hypothetical protein